MTALTLRAVGTGLLASLVGYASTVALVIAGLASVGATQAQIVSGLVAIGFSKGIVATYLSLSTRMPISVAWTTPGVALLAATGAVEGGFPAAVGAFMVTGALIILTGFWGPLGRWVAAIPKPLANAMLAGILLKLCLTPFLAMAELPVIAGLIFLTWLVVGRFARAYAVPAAAAVMLVGLFFQAPVMGAEGVSLWPSLTLSVPVFTWQAMVTIALPLFIVTMASQNIPGLAVLASFGYHPPVRRAFLATGLASMLSAPLGAPTVNFAAITAALCASPDAHPDPRQRYIAAVASGFGYVAATALAGVVVAMISRSPPILIEAVAGLALIGSFGAALFAAVEAEAERIPALVTLLVTASGLTFFGVGSAFWGLVLGVAVHQLQRFRPA